MAKLSGWTRIVTLLLLSLRLRGAVPDKWVQNWYNKVHGKKRKAR